MRTLGIDLGTRRVGLALSDAGGKLATPYDLVEVVSAQQAMEPILKVIEKEGVERLIVGLPLNMDDSIGPMALATVRWGQEMARQTGLPVLFVDERLSSFEAEQVLKERKRAGEKLTRKDKKQRIDALAATEFLQAFLDGKLVPLKAG